MVGGSGISASCQAEIAAAMKQEEPFKRAFALERIRAMPDALLLSEVQMALTGHWGAHWYAGALKDEAARRKMRVTAA